MPTENNNQDIRREKVDGKTNIETFLKASRQAP